MTETMVPMEGNRWLMRVMGLMFTTVLVKRLLGPLGLSAWAYAWHLLQS